MYRKNTAGQFIGIGLIKAADGTALTGATIAVRRCIDGTFAAGGGTVTEDSAGLYKYAMAQADTNGNDVTLYFTATSAIPITVNFITTAADPTDGVRFGLTALPNAAASAIGGLPLAVDTSGRVDVLKINGTSQTARDIGASVLLAAGQKVDVDTIKTNPVVNAGTVTFPTGATLASTTNITAGTIATVTNLTNAPTAGDLTATMKASVTTAATAATPTAAAVTGAVGSVTGAVGSVTGAVGSVTGNVGGNVAGSIGSLGTTAKTDVSTAVLTTQMTESYAANGSAPTLAQAMFAIHQDAMDFTISGTSWTVKKLDNSTTAFVKTLNDATNPTAAART